MTTDMTGMLVIGVLIMGLVVMARICGLSGRRGWRVNESSPPPEPAADPKPSATGGFRDPSR